MKLVLFSAEWCSPGRMLLQIVDKVITRWCLEYETVDVDTNWPRSESAGVSHVPTLILYDDDEELGRREGAAPGPVIESWIEEVLA